MVFKFVAFPGNPAKKGEGAMNPLKKTWQWGPGLVIWAVVLAVLLLPYPAQAVDKH
jgi:hypothetical protein